VPGTGIVVRCALPAGGAANLEVYDVTGRRRTAAVVATSGLERDVTLGDTGALGSGIYFVRLSRGSQSASARVLVSH